MGAVISLDKYREKKEQKTTDTVKQRYRDSLDNNKVKQKYKLGEDSPQIQQRIKKIKDSIERINKLMDEGSKQ